MRGIAALLVALTLALAGAPAAVAATCPRTSLGEVESEVMCLQCGVPLDVATNAPDANRERAFIQQLAAQCKSKDQIEAALVAEYGERVLASPKAEGFNVAAYAVPALGFLAALTLVTLAALRWRGRRPDSPAPIAEPAPGGAGDSARLDADLRRYEL